jgi:hypothetical protein
MGGYAQLPKLEYEKSVWVKRAILNGDFNYLPAYHKFMNEAKSVLNTYVDEHISKQIEADGSQFHGLKHNKSSNYSVLNLSILVCLEFYAKKVGVETLGRISNEGYMQMAYYFLVPYLNKKNTWPNGQIGNMDKAIERLRRLFLNSGSLLDIQAYCAIAPQLQNTDDNQQLIYPYMME